MKKYFLLLFVIVLSCKSKDENKNVSRSIEPEVFRPVPGKINNHVSANGSYALYVPESCLPERKYPAIIFLDPHAKGDFPLSKYKHLADLFRFILIGSFDSKNGMNFEQINPIVSGLITEATILPQVDTGRIMLAGFSGGAKAALICGNQVRGIHEIIYCGAALPPGSIELKVPVLGFAGKYDMNYTEVINFDRSLDKTILYHSITEWKGKHEWPDSVVFSKAFYWSLFNRMRSKPEEINATLIAGYKQLLSNEFNQKMKPIERFIKLKEAINFLEKISPVDEYEKQLEKLENSSEFKNEQKTELQILAQEETKKQEFISSFIEKDIDWWKREINALRKEKNNASDQRLLGYISLAAWSYSSRVVKENDANFAGKALQIYELADPENPEHAFLKACLFAKNGLADSAIVNLKKSIFLGLDDKSKLENESDLNSLQSRSDFLEIKSMIPSK